MVQNGYLKRNVDGELLAWVRRKNRKPLLLRGARQTGKSSTVRNLSRQFDFYIEVNFEENTQAHKLFATGNLSPHAICENLSALYGIPVTPGKTLVFFDEIQACLPAISSLRFFYEQLPELHLIAAGSLLEFALAEVPSFGVGRVRSLFLYPFSFYEFLTACGESILLQAIRKATVESPLHDAIHQKAIQYLKRFLIIGGMPEVVANYVANKDLIECQRVLDDLMISLRADFVKYKKQVPSLQISVVFDGVVRQTGKKFMLSKTGKEFTHYQLKEGLELLKMAGLVIPVTHTSANGIPLGAECDLKKQKMLLLDTGLLQRVNGLNINDILLADDFDFINKGSIAELYVGLELLKSVSCYEQTALYYWHREATNSQAEVDYIIQSDDQILPIEVKSGTSGKMQSLFLFLKEKQRAIGIRTSLENFSKYDPIRVYPLYAIANLRNVSITK